MPDRFLRAQLAQPAPGEAAADGERQRDDLAVGERRHADQQADNRAGVRARDQADDERPFEREIGRVIVQKEPRGDAGCQRQAEGERQNEPIAPAAALENQNVAEAPVPDQHRGERRHDGQLHHERRQEHLLG